MRKIFDPEKAKEQVRQELEAKRKEKKAKKQVTVETNTGEKATRAVSQAEYDRIRLEMARKQDKELYGDD